MIEDIINKNPGTVLIGIDGCGGSGKSTLAKKLLGQLREIREVTIVHMDDFYLPSNQRRDSRTDGEIGVNFDWKRLEKQVLLPLSSGAESKYQIYDWDSDTLMEWKNIPQGIVIIEGVYTLRQELFKYYQFTIWVEASYQTRLLRGVERDGEDMRNIWEQVWMPAEQHYVETEQPFKRADLIINGSSDQTQ